MSRRGIAHGLLTSSLGASALALVVAALALPSALAVPLDSVTITSGPSGETTSTTATFTFTGDGAVTDFRCQLDAARVASPCTSPTTYTGLALGDHSFTVYGYRGATPVGVSDTRRWRIVASGPPPPPPGLQARLTAPSTASPGSLVAIDASASTGEIAALSFDLDGNGSFETKCGKTPQAGAVYTQPGTYTVSVLAETGSGAVSTAKAVVTVGGAPTPPPSGTKALTQGVLVGSCVAPETSAVEAIAKAYGCPTTVIVGVAEAVPKNPGEFCFERVQLTTPEPRELFVARKGAWASVNGIWVRPATASASVTLDATIKRIYMHGGSGPDAAKASTWIYLPSPQIDVESSKHHFVWDVGKPSVVGTFAGGGPGDRFLGLGVPTFAAPLSFTAARRAKVPLAVTLPYPFAGVASGKLTLETDNTKGPVITSFQVALGNVPLGIFEARDVKLSYTREGADDVWKGGLTLAFPPVGSGIVAKGSLGLRNGSLDSASASFEKPTPGFGPLGCCVWMTKFGGTLTSSEIEASATLTAGPAVAGKALVSLDGKLRVSLLVFSLSAKGEFYVVGVKLGNGSVLMTDSGVSFLGSFGQTFAGVLEATATVAGGLYSSGFWYASGAGSLCIKTSAKDFCAGGGVALSSKGIAGCVKVIANVGAVVYWNGGWNIFWSCSFNVLKQKVGAPNGFRTTSSVGILPTTLTIRPGLSKALIRLTGAGDAPRVRVEGPGGVRFEVPGTGGNYVEDARRLVLRLPEKRTTDIVLLRPTPGTWRISALPGSTAVTSVAQADPLPTRLVTGRLTGTGRERVLRYTTTLERGQRVSFLERGQGVDSLIGRTTAARGAIRFTLADGRAGPRRIDAVVESDGIPIRTETVVRFRSPGPPVLSAPHVVAARTTRGLSVRWSAVRGATAYRVRVALGDGRLATALRAPGRRSLLVRGFDARTSATVTVQALSSSYRAGLPARARVAARPSVSAPTTIALRDLRRTRALTVTCVPGADGVCAVRASVRGRLVGTGSARGAYARPIRVRVRLTAKGLTGLRSGDTLIVHAAVPGDGTKVTRSVLR